MIGGAWNIVLAGVFAIAIIHKGLAIVQGTVSALPAVESLNLPSWAAAPVVGAAMCAESFAAALLLASPPAGLALTAAILGVYTVQLLRMDPSSDCGCMGTKSSTGAGIVRNICLLIGTGLVLAVDETGIAESTMTDGSVALALLLLAPVVGQVVLSNFGMQITFHHRKAVAT